MRQNLQCLCVSRLGSQQVFVQTLSRLTFAFRPNLQMASQSRRDCSDAAGLVSSICEGKEE
jgi:hypothetical protein